MNAKISCFVALFLILLPIWVIQAVLKQNNLEETSKHDSTVPDVDLKKNKQVQIGANGKSFKRPGHSAFKKSILLEEQQNHRESNVLEGQDKVPGNKAMEKPTENQTLITKDKCEEDDDKFCSKCNCPRKWNSHYYYGTLCLCPYDITSVDNIDDGHNDNVKEEEDDVEKEATEDGNAQDDDLSALPSSENVKSSSEQTASQANDEDDDFEINSSEDNNEDSEDDLLWIPKSSGTSKLMVSSTVSEVKSTKKRSSIKKAVRFHHRSSKNVKAALEPERKRKTKNYKHDSRSKLNKVLEQRQPRINRRKRNHLMSENDQLKLFNMYANYDSEFKAASEAFRQMKIPIGQRNPTEFPEFLMRGLFVLYVYPRLTSKFLMGFLGKSGLLARLEDELDLRGVPLYKGNNGNFHKYYDKVKGFNKAKHRLQIYLDEMKLGTALPIPPRRRPEKRPALLAYVSGSDSEEQDREEQYHAAPMIISNNAEKRPREKSLNQQLLAFHQISTSPPMNSTQAHSRSSKRAKFGFPQRSGSQSPTKDLLGD